MAEPAAVVEELMRAAEARDFDRMAAVLDDEVVYHNIPVEPVRGAEAVIATLRQFLGTAEELQWVVHMSAADGEVVFNERTDRALRGGKWSDLPVAGVFVVRDGRVREWRDYFDLATAMGGPSGTQS